MLPFVLGGIKSALPYSKSQDRIRLEGSYSSYECQPFNEDIGSDFVCAYRVTGDGVINSGLKENLDVIAMGNGKVTELLDESTNLFSEEYIARSIYGDEIVTGATEDTSEFNDFPIVSPTVIFCPTDILLSTSNPYITNTYPLNALSVSFILIPSLDCSLPSTGSSVQMCTLY